MAQTERLTDRLLYMLARYTDCMSDKDREVDYLLTNTFHGIGAWTGKISVAWKLSTGYFLPQDAHPNLLQLLDTLGSSINFFSRAKDTTTRYNARKAILDSYLQKQADLLNGQTKSLDKKRDLRIAREKNDRAQRELDTLVEQRTELEQDKKKKVYILPFRYRTVLEALEAARVDFDVIAVEKQPKYGCNKVPDRVEAVVKAGNRIRITCRLFDPY